MLTAPKTLEKLRRIERTYDELIYEPVMRLESCYLETEGHLRAVPGPDAMWKKCPSGTEWGHDWGSAWFRATASIPAEFAGRPVYLLARTGAVEAMFWLDGEPSGIFNYDPFIRNRGNHRVQLITASAEPSRTYMLAVEGYAGHPTPGSQPGERPETQDIYPYPFKRVFDRMELCLRNDETNDFVLDLRALNQLSGSLSSDSFRKGAIDAGLAKVFSVVHQDPVNASADEWRKGLTEAREIMRPLLAYGNGDSAPFAGLVGHSHMDTAWHWTIDETVRKCARTYSNALRLMEQYPEYRFIQSSTYHAELMRRHYPGIFDGIRKRVADGRWEPNGGVWIEPDVNLSSGESLIRQFLFGQTFSKKYFNYEADAFWLPDSFGYSAALPQILRGCGIRYFLTTKLTWNESNTFPYDTFWWKGIDGTRVFAHFNDIHCAPDPETLINKLHGTGPKDFRVVQNCVRHKDVNNMRLISYGFGDGGGGPDPQMIEMSRRCRNLEGCPRSEHVSVSRFMTELQETAVDAPCFCGELYVEGHRGTLTQMHQIKRLNRIAEFAMREAEFLQVYSGIKPDYAAGTRLHDLWELLLVNQFHDILPGTSIQEVHERAVEEYEQVIEGAQSFCSKAADASVENDAGDSITIYNSLSWRRDEAQLANPPSDMEITGDGILSQTVETPWKERKLILDGLNLPPLGAKSFLCRKASAESGNTKSGYFDWDGQCLRTDKTVVKLNSNGGISSLVDIECGRELCDSGNFSLNTFLFGEDVPMAWDNWDIDADLPLKLRAELRLQKREVVGQGPLQFRIRQSFMFGKGSSLVQDIVFHSLNSRIDFETMIDWREKHHFLAALFPFNLCVGSARHEIQFGHIVRPTHRNFSEDRARFEVLQHKWTDLSENRFGVAVLNDCKYGCSVEGATMRLSLHKGGTHPDPRGDEGVHICKYSLLPHQGGFTAENVIRPAYELNASPFYLRGKKHDSSVSLFNMDSPNIIVETVKPSEDGEGYVVRMYESECSACRTILSFPHAPKRVELTDMLEMHREELTVSDGEVQLDFRAFEIKTLKIRN